MKKSASSWISYLKSLKSSLYEPELHLGAFDAFMYRGGFEKRLLSQLMPSFFLLDYKRKAYLKISNSFAGYSAQCFLREGLAHTIEIFHPDTLRIYNGEIFPERRAFIKKLDPNEVESYIFTYNGKMKAKKGEYINFLQRSSFVCDDDGNPLYSFGFVIADHCGDRRFIRNTVERLSTGKSDGSELVIDKVYYLYEYDRGFSKRELDVLAFMAEGLSSKMIAEKLCISENTVINHRRNMLQKSGLPNAISLVSFAIKNELI